MDIAAPLDTPVVAAGDAPEVVTQAASEHHAFNPAPDVNFHVYRLGEE